MASPSFQVIYPKVVQGQLRELNFIAAGLGMSKAFVQALFSIHMRLRTDPDQFGEEVYELTKMQIRHAIISPLLVYWGVNQADQVVFVKSIEPYGL